MSKFPNYDTISILELKKISDSSIIDMNDVVELFDYFEKNYLILLDNSFQNLDFDSMRPFFVGIDDFIRKYSLPFGDFPLKIRYGSLVGKDAITSSYGFILVGKSGLTSYATGIHEFVHVLDFFSFPFEGKFYSEVLMERVAKRMGGFGFIKNFQKANYFYYWFE